MSRLYPESQWEWEQDWSRYHKALAVRAGIDMETHLDLLEEAWNKACKTYNPSSSSLATWANKKLAWMMAERAEGRMLRLDSLDAQQVDALPIHHAAEADLPVWRQGDEDDQILARAAARSPRHLAVARHALLGHLETDEIAAALGVTVRRVNQILADLVQALSDRGPAQLSLGV